jgi:F-type H+-transporting ATPase subunit b
LKRRIIAAAFAACLAWAQEPHKAAERAKEVSEETEGHESTAMPNEIWWKWANFAILASGLGYLIAKNAPPFFRARTEEIQKGIRDAAAVRAEAEARAAEIEKRVANLNAEVEILRLNSREEITREGERIRAETARQIGKIQHQAEADIASAAKNAVHELKAYSAELAVSIAARQIEQQMTPQNQEQLANAFVDDLQRKATLN